MSKELEQLKFHINEALPLAKAIYDKAVKMENTKLTRACYKDTIEDLENIQAIIANTEHLNNNLKRDL